MTDEEIIAVVTAKKNGAKIYFRPSHGFIKEWFPAKGNLWDFNSFDYRVEPTPKLRPFTDDEAIQLLGAIAVAPDGRRGSIGLRSPGFRLIVCAYGDMDLSKFAKEGWRWKWAHEHDDQLKPFGVVEGVE